MLVNHILIGSRFQRKLTKRKSHWLVQGGRRAPTHYIHGAMVQEQDGAQISTWYVRAGRIKKFLIWVDLYLGTGGTRTPRLPIRLQNVSILLFWKDASQCLLVFPGSCSSSVRTCTLLNKSSVIFIEEQHQRWIWSGVLEKCNSPVKTSSLVAPALTSPKKTKKLFKARKNPVLIK